MGMEHHNSQSADVPDRIDSICFRAMSASKSVSYRAGRVSAWSILPELS